MILLTRYDIPLPAAGTHPTSVSQPLRRGIGLRLYDLALLVPPGRSGKERSGKGRSRERRIRGVTTILEDAGFRTVVLAAPGDTEGPPEPVMTESVADARALVILLEEGSSPGGSGSPGWSDSPRRSKSRRRCCR